MCGINGFIQFQGSYSPGSMKDIVHRMNERIIHRGPDSEGLYADETCALGMRRLAVIDVDNGSQPIWNADRTMMIVFNGELYNFRELKKMLTDKGCVFKTNSDTEVALVGFETYRFDFFSMMEGMFALAIYDVRNKKWILARDRIGEKPLYYYKNDSYFLFSSELKSILGSGLVPKQIDEKGLSQYFQLSYIPAPKSIIKDVHKLMPATYMVLSRDGELKSNKYWELKINSDPIYTDYAACKKMLREAVFSSVEKRMISDVPLGAFLSGGIDSTVIVGVMSALSRERVNTFTIGFEEKEYDETDLAGIVARRNNTNHHVFCLNWDEAFGDVMTVLSNIDEPFADPSLLATYAVSKMAREYVTVVLTGDAGDELFAGYNKYLVTDYSRRYNALPRFVRKGIIEPAVKLMPTDRSLTRKAYKVIDNARKDVFSQQKSVMYLGFEPTEASKLMPGIAVGELKMVDENYQYLLDADEKKRAQYVDLKVLLEGDMLAKVDRASMRASLETRVPLLDSRIVELAFNMPTRFKIRNAERKIIFTDTFQEFIPSELLKAPKHGFDVPIDRWLKRELKTQLERFSGNAFVSEQGLFDAGFVSELVSTQSTIRSNRTRKLWTYFVFQYWYENVFVNAPNHEPNKPMNLSGGY